MPKRKKAAQEVEWQVKQQSPDSVRERMSAATKEFREVRYEGLVLMWGVRQDGKWQVVETKSFYRGDSQAKVLRNLVVCEAETIRKMGGPELDMLERKEYLEIRMRASATTGRYPIGRFSQ